MIVLILLALLALPAGAAGSAVEDWPCVVCHPSRDRETFERLSEDGGALVGSESAQGFVCLSCHNGSVRDSRRILLRGGQHPSGFRPGRALPGPFRLYPGGRMECGTCHSPHGKGEAARRWMRRLPRGNEPCASCHRGREERHLGAVVGAGAAAAVRTRGGRLEDGRVVCATCHTAHGARGPSLLIEPYGPDRDDLCRVCHAGLAVKGQAAAGSSPACARCHEPHSPRPLLAPAGPVCSGCHADHAGPGDHPTLTPYCSECHSVHHPVRPPGAERALLRVLPAGGMLCSRCHPDAGPPHAAGLPVEASRPGLLRRRGLAPDARGRLDCTTCHRSHGARAPGLLVLGRGRLCLYCHPRENPFGPDGPRAGPHPVGVSFPDGDPLTCSTCHRAHGTGPPPRSCEECHPDSAAGAGHGGVPGCGACHAVHGPLPPVRRCAGCHDDVGTEPLHPGSAGRAAPGLPLFDGQGRPSPWGKLACPTCHDPHAPGAGPRRPPGPLCLACHRDKAPVAEGAHGSGGADPCGTCHPPHGPPASPDACGGCHDPHIRSLRAHTAEGPPAWKDLGGRLPLFDRFGRRNPYGFVTCATCHDVHRPGGFRLEPRDPPRLCLACHGDKATLLGSAHDPRSGSGGSACELCHPMHSREVEPPLWELRADARGTWNDRKCAGCHGPPSDGPSPHGGPRSHPVNRSLPDRMDSGTLPLYDALGGRHGRLVACGTCHDIHGVPAGTGGAIPRFLRLPARDGSLCGTCHGDEAAVAGTPHDLRPAGPGALGPCSPCHTAHRAQDDRALWGLDPAPGPYPPNRLCRSCHRQGGPVRGKGLLMQYHMTDAEPLRTPRGTIYLQRPMLLMDEWALKSLQPPVLPLYDRRGNPGPVGNLQCVSCHDPHRWSPLGAFVKPGFGALGPNVPTRFLRLREARQVERSVCSVCHPSDAVERYRRYHEVWTDVGKEFR